MPVGIVSWCTGENKPKGFLKKAEICRLSHSFVAAQLPFSKEKLENINPKKLRKAIKKAEDRLKTEGAERIILCNEIKEALGERTFDLGEEFYKFAPYGILSAANQFSLKPPFPLAVRKKAADASALYVIRKLIFECGDIKILTDSTEKGEKLCDEIMDEFGAAAEVLPYNFVFRRGITADLDEHKICLFGNTALSDFEAEVETFGYSLNSLEVFAAQNTDFEGIKIKSCRCGKNKLTLKAF